jgi:thiamine biosynthesis lipoprotein
MFAVLGATLDARADIARQDREMMHTVVSVAIADPLEEAALDAAFDDAFAVFADVEENMNEWKQGSPLWKINASAGGEPVEAAAPLCGVINASLDGARRTHGLFDPTWAALKDLWRFPEDGNGKIPPPDAVKKTCSLIRHQDVVVKPAAHKGCTVRLPRAGMKLGLGGVVKGWGVDQAASRLRARGLKNFFIQAGGDLYFAGKSGDKPWRAGIRDPRGPADKVFARLEVEDRAFSTSGDYEHFFIADGVRYHHIIDPRTCQPGNLSRSVTILAKSATDAEFLSKAVFLLGGKKGLELAESWGAAAVIVDADNKVHMSKALEGKVTLGLPTP